MTARLKRSIPLGLLLAALVSAYLGLGWAYAVMTPPFEKPDEEWHYAYAAYIVQNGRLPPLTNDPALNPARQIAGHPPLYYLLAALIVRGAALDVSRPLPDPNPYWSYPAPGTAPDNKNRFVHSPSESFPAVWVLRAFSLLTGAVTVVCAYGVGNELSGQARMGLLSAAFIAFHPQYLFIAGSVSNDSLVASLASAAIWALLIVVRQGRQWKAWLVFGLFAGLSALAKTNAVMLQALGAGVALGLGWHHRSISVATKGVLASAALWLILAGGWYARNMLLYGDPLGVGVHLAEFARGQTLALADLPGQAAVVAITFWGAFGWTNVALPDWAYQGLYLFQFLAVIGVAWVWVEKIRRPQRLWPMAVVTGNTLLIFLGFIWWAVTLQGTLGRLLFPALVSLAVLMMAGLNRLWRFGPGAFICYLATTALIGPSAILPAYQQPSHVVGPPNGVEAAHFDIGHFARLFAFQVTPHRIAPGEQVQVTLCWQGRAVTSEFYSVFVQLVGPEDRLVGARNTYPGLGRYATPLWNLETSFCDVYDVPVVSDAPRPAVYAVAVGMFDLKTGQRLPVADAAGRRVDLLTLGAVKVTGPGANVPLSAESMSANFGDEIELRGVELVSARPGATAQLTLYWQALNTPSSDYTVFVHLLDASGQIVAQADSPPQSGRYPTLWWDSGEGVADTHLLALPSNLPAGDYSLRIGLYELESGARLPVMGTGEDALNLGVVHVQP
jgi:hypothetical protein